MKQLTCEICGSTDVIKQDGVFICQTCGCKYSVDDVNGVSQECRQAIRDYAIEILSSL